MSAPSHQPATVFVVDDDAGLAWLIERKLRQDGYHTASAGSGREAKIWLDQHHADILLLDLKLPDMNGPQLIKEMVDAGRLVPFIVITGQGDERVAVDMMKRGALDYVVKDGNFLDFIPTIVRRGMEQLERERRLETAEKSRRESEARYRHLVRALPIAVYSCDSAGRITLFNDAAVALWGRQPIIDEDHWCGAHGLFDSKGSPIPPDQCPVAQALRKGGPIRDVELIIERPDHTRRHVLTFADPIRDESGAVTGAVNMLADITERKELQQAQCARDAAEHENHAKDDFLAVLSHELRTPLAPVLLVAEEGAQDSTLPASVRADFDMIARNVALEARLIDDILDLTLITTGKMSLDPRPVELHTVLNEALNTVQAKIKQKRLRLDLKFSAGNSEVMADAMRLQQVLWNVLKNAVKFTPVDGQLKIETWRDSGAGRVLVKVTDSGIGMTPAELERVFQAFSQGDHARSGGSRDFGGLGLGLAISRKLLALQSGRISATSQGRGKGAEFVVELPLLVTRPFILQKEAAATVTSCLGDRMAPHQNPRILLVEDDEVSRTTLTRLLNRRRYNVTSAGSVQEALEIANGGGIDILIADIGLPDGNGNELMETLRKSHPILIGIAMTGYAMDKDLSRSRQAGFAAHLIKPVPIEILEKALTEAFALLPVAEESALNPAQAGV